MKKIYVLAFLLVSPWFHKPIGIAVGLTRPVNRVKDCVQITFSHGAELAPSVSPVGDLLSFEYFHPDRPNVPQIWIMNRAQGFKSARPVVDNENYNSWPSWSPDGQWISFMSHAMQKGTSLTSQIYKVKVSDGTIVPLTHFPPATALGDSTSWSRDGRIAFEYDDDIYVVSESGGIPKRLVDLKSVLPSGGLWGIEWSPDGSRLAFRGALQTISGRAGRIWVADSDGRRIRPVTEGGADEDPSWLDNQHILFERWTKTGEVRICLVSLSTSIVEYLTRGHLDLDPAAGSADDLIFFARGVIPEAANKTQFPDTHIYALGLGLR
ncbi:MAG: hypothetical protein WAL82_03750 [Candidatus Acidiferrales bacterium]